MKNNGGWHGIFFLFFLLKMDRSRGDMGREIKRWRDRGSGKDGGRVEREGWELSPAMILLNC